MILMNNASETERTIQLTVDEIEDLNMQLQTFPSIEENNKEMSFVAEVWYLFYLVV